MTGNLDAFCERCGKTALSPVSVGAAGAGSGVLRRLHLGGRSAQGESAGTSALRLCLGCRGYICSDCWNDEAAVCQTCQPLNGMGVSVQAEVPEEEPPPGLEIFDQAPTAEPASMPLAWPASDLQREPQRGEDDSALVVESEEAPEPEQLVHSDAAEDAESPAMPAIPDVATDTATTADSFDDDRWAEILGRIQAVGTSAPAEPLPEPTQSAVEESAAEEWELASPAQLEQVAVEGASQTFEESVLAELATDVEPVAAAEEQVAADLEPVAAAELGAAPEEPVAADLEPVAAAEEPVAADELGAAREEPVAPDLEPVTVAEEPVAADELVAVDLEPVTPPAESIPGADEQVVSSADTEDVLRAAVPRDADAPVDPERSEPDSQELTRLLQPRRVRRRVPKPLTRRPLRPPIQPEPTATAPSIKFAAESAVEPMAEPAVERITEPSPALATRSLKLPPALPPPSTAATQPWPMPAPPAFLPPPPPAMSTIQPAPARFRPQNVPVDLPKPLTTRPCGNCGLELSAKVTFCRRCGNRQPLPA